jgi:hypothetical protein
LHSHHGEGEREHDRDDEAAHGNLVSCSPDDPAGCERCDARLITARRLGTDWPVVEGRVRRFLQSQRAPGPLVDDLLQEVATRAMTSGFAYTDVEELVRWSCTVARNLLVSEHRRVSRSVNRDAPAQAAAADQRALDRLEMRSVIEAIARLSARDQEALLGQLRPPAASTGRRGDVRANVALFRARSRLQHLLGVVLAPVVLAWPRWRGRGVGVAALAVAATVPIAFVAMTPTPTSPPATEQVTTAPPVSRGIDAPRVAGVVAADATAGRRPAIALPAPGTAKPRTVRHAPAPPATPSPPVTVRVATPVGPHQTRVREKNGPEPLVCARKLPVVSSACVG